MAGRPKPAILLRRNVLVVALKLIDEEGLDALSIRRLGLELSVHGTSLYHHFSDKEMIVIGAAELALEDVKTPETTTEDWPVWVMRNNRKTREALLAHPHLIPVVLDHSPLTLGTPMLESTVALLRKQGLRIEDTLPMLESLEMIAISSAMYAYRSQRADTILPDEQRYPNLRRAYAERHQRHERLFEIACEAVIASYLHRSVDSSASLVQ